MRRLTFILLAAGLFGLGCNSAGKKSGGSSPPPSKGGPTPFWSEDRATQPPDNRGLPASDSAQGIIAGRLVDNSGQPQINAVVNVTPANASPGAKPIGVQTDEQGFFIIKGLAAGTTYTLSARNEDRGRVLGATTTAQAPNTRMLIRLSEGNAPAAAPSQPQGGNGGAFVTPPPAEKKDGGKTKLAEPKMSIPSPDPAPTRDPLTGSDQSWSPGKAPPQATPLPPPPPTKKDNPNVADGGPRDWPPPASVPSPAPAQVEPPPPPITGGMSAVPSNSSPLTGVATQQQQPRLNFTLYDSAGNPVEFQNLSDRRLVVLDFWTTTCMPCLRKVPELIELQSRYASYVEIAGVACDDLPFAQRRKAVDGIRDYYLRKSPRPINYGIWFEGDGQEGRVQSQFRVKAYPTMVLLDHSGRELWRGSDVRQLEDAIKYSLMRK